MNKAGERLVNGLVKENPTFVLMLGMCPTLAVTTSAMNGLGMGLGFSFALTCIGALRELLGSGKVFDFQVMPDSFVPVGIFVLAPGAFFVLATLTAIQNKVKIIGEKKGKDMSKIQSGCNSDCMNCSDSGCARRLYDDKADGKKNGAVNERTEQTAEKVTKEDEKNG